MAGIFARLKLRLIRNGLRSSQYAILFGIGAVGAGVLALVGFTTLAALRNDSVAPDATVVIFGGITLAWTVIPLLGFGTDETLDPQRLALLPLRRSQLLRGLLVAALLGVAPIATLIALSGAIVGLPQSLAGAMLVSAAVVATLLFCIITSRALISLLAPLLRSRRGRDLMVMVVALAAFVPQSFRLFNANSGTGNTDRAFAEIAQRIRYTPIGIGGFAASEAGRDHFLAAAAALGALIGLIAFAYLIWSWAMPSALVTADISQRESKHRRGAVLFPRALPFLPRNRTGAIAAKELRYFARDPR
ncbi:MAG TPA: hypothetical protein VFR41_03415, partial [Acidimicrobiia bacterium]|nr:hypothetical protein [Acidimicrobiia bacterium]